MQNFAFIEMVGLLKEGSVLSDIYLVLKMI